MRVGSLFVPGLAVLLTTRLPHFRVVEHKLSALLYKTLQADAATAAKSSSSPDVLRESLGEVFSSIQLARIGLHIGGNERLVLLRQPPEFVPVEPFLGKVA